MHLYGECLFKLYSFNFPISFHFNSKYTVNNRNQINARLQRSNIWRILWDIVWGNLKEFRRIFSNSLGHPLDMLVCCYNQNQLYNSIWSVPLSSLYIKLFTINKNLTSLSILLLPATSDYSLTFARYWRIYIYTSIGETENVLLLNYDDNEIVRTQKKSEPINNNV